MPLFRSLTTKIKTAISSPSTSPLSSPTSTSPSQTSSPTTSSSSTSSTSGFEVLSGRKEPSSSSSFKIKRPEQNVRIDSFMSSGATSNASNESVDQTEKKLQRRVSRFREELDWETE